MTHSVLNTPISPLRQRLIEDMNMRRFSRETQRNYLRDIGRLATFLGRSPDTATADDLRRFQIEQQEDGVPVPTMNSIVSALRFFFTHALDRLDLARRLVRSAQYLLLATLGQLTGRWSNSPGWPLQPTKSLTAAHYAGNSRVHSTGTQISAGVC